jgi:hypothetical protein
VQFRAALAYNHFGEKDLTIQWLRKALAGGLTANQVERTPDFDHLRADPSFQAILRDAK